MSQQHLDALAYDQAKQATNMIDAEDAMQLADRHDQAHRRALRDTQVRRAAIRQWQARDAVVRERSA